MNERNSLEGQYKKGNIGLFIFILFVIFAVGIGVGYITNNVLNSNNSNGVQDNEDAENNNAEENDKAEDNSGSNMANPEQKYTYKDVIGSYQYKASKYTEEITLLESGLSEKVHCVNDGECIVTIGSYVVDSEKIIITELVNINSTGTKANSSIVFTIKSNNELVLENNIFNRLGSKEEQDNLKGSQWKMFIEDFIKYQNDSLNN